MSYSLGETGRLCRRAAHGAGLSWGMSDEASDAVMWLHRHSLPGAQMLAGYLKINDLVRSCDIAPTSLTGVWSATAGRLCPLSTGAALSDCADRLKSGEVIRMLDVTHPLLIVPFAANAAQAVEACVKLQWEGVCIIVGGDVLDVTGDMQSLLNPENVHVSCELALKHDVKGASASASASAPFPLPSEYRAQLDQECLVALLEFAQRTYAPATEDSRLLGAGAGLDGND